MFHEAAKQFKTMKTTRYQHKTEVDQASGSYRYDCVGFVSYALKQAAPQARESAFKALDIKPGRIPTPGKYAAFFAGLAEKPQQGWQPVSKASELRPGDVVAWERKTATSNGHAVVIASIPVAGPDDTWVVTVYDSTSSPHADDSRKTDERAEPVNEGGKRSGLGHGVMAFTADPKTGVLTGYRWSPKAKTDTCPIAAGRPTS
ncbi:MAG: CHAP domain-containing protein [Gemmataceae bacterium]|nr:CHAP domain-containing protein [Gemmataceae bacterium]